MKPENAKEEFESYLKIRELNSNRLTPVTGVEAMLSFYRDVRADGCDFNEGEDMLLFQWGTYNWGKGAHFEFNLTRQFITGESEDDDIWQLLFTFKFAPDKELRELGHGNKWCNNIQELTGFTEFIQSSGSYLKVEMRFDADVELHFEQAE